jgi:hypothetical protein
MGEVTAWVTSSCRDLGLVVISPGELAHDRPWSRVVVYDIDDADGARGRVWFKANGIGTRHEPGLLSALTSLVPDLVPEVLAIDPARAWSLTRDAGPTWRSAIPVADHWPLWEDLLQRYAVAQLGLAGHRKTVLATGMPERSPATLPGQAAELVAELTLRGVTGEAGEAGEGSEGFAMDGEGFGTGGEDPDELGGLSVTDSRALEARLPAYGQWCRELDAGGIPCTIQHDDLHSNNICRTELSPGRAIGPSDGSRIIDWGDASWGHPFGTMLSTLRSIAHHSGCGVDDPRVDRVRDAYLEPFTTYAPRSDLIAMVDVAQRVGALTRALSWRAALIESPTAVQREYDFPVRGWLQELLPAL